MGVVPFILLAFLVGQTADVNAPWPAPLASFMDRLAEQAEAEGPVAPTANGDDDFAKAISQSQNLAEQGRYDEASRVLAGLIDQAAAPLADDWKGMLDTRIAILRRGASQGRLGLDDYRTFYLATGPHWFHQRKGPIVALWKRDDLPRPDRLFLIAALLDRLGAMEPVREGLATFKGEATVLEAIAGQQGVDEATVAEALLLAGDVRARGGDAHGAIENWSAVVERSPESGQAIAALAEKGKLREAQKSYAEAIADYGKLLLQRPGADARGRRGVLWGHHAYHAALGLSRCYEASGDLPRSLQFAREAKSLLGGHTHCGTCLATEGERLDDRINSLTRREAVAR